MSWATGVAAAVNQRFYCTSAYRLTFLAYAFDKLQANCRLRLYRMYEQCENEVWANGLSLEWVDT